MTDRPLSAVAHGELVHVQLPGVTEVAVLSATEAVDLLEQLRVLAPVMAEETARVSDRGDRFGRDEGPIDRASRLPDDGFPRNSDRPPPGAPPDVESPPLATLPRIK